MLVNLVRRLHQTVHIEVLVVDHYFLFKGFDLTLFHLSHLLDHVVTRDKHSLEVGWIRERLLVLDFTVKVWLAIFGRIVL